MEGTEELLKRLSENNQLKTFHFEIPSQKFLALQVILDCLDCWASLENLKLRMAFEIKDLISKTFLEKLPENLTKSKELKVLKFYFNEDKKKIPRINSNNKNSEKDSSSIQLCLKDCLDKLSSLKEFTLKSDLIEPALLFEIFQMCQNTPYLQKLSIDLGQIVLLKDSCIDLVMMIQELKKLQVLKLPGLIISSSQFLQKTVESLVKGATIEKFEIESCLGTIPPELPISQLMKLLSTRRMKKLVINSDREDIKKLFEGQKGAKKLEEMRNRIQRTNLDVDLSSILYYFTGREFDRFDLEWRMIDFHLDEEIF